MKKTRVMYLILILVIMILGLTKITEAATNTSPEQTYEKPILTDVIKEKNIDYISEEIQEIIKQSCGVRVIIKLNNPDKKDEVKKYLNYIIVESRELLSAIVGEKQLIDLVSNINPDDIESIQADHKYKIELTEVIQITRTNLAWDYDFTGKGQSVCVVDTGIDYNHELLSDKYIGGYDFVNMDDDPMDDNGHGTYVSGIIAGIAPSTKLVAVKVFTNNGTSFESDILMGIDYCLENKEAFNISIILLAFGGGFYNTTCFCDDNLVAEKANYAVSQGLFVVAASGDEGADYLKAPSCGSNVTSVGATDDNNNIASFTHINPLLDLLAPGVNITSTKLGGGEEKGSGSSASAAVVAGIAALILEDTRLAPLDLQYRLRSTGFLIQHNTNDYPRIDAYSALINKLTNLPDEQEGKQCKGTWEGYEPLTIDCIGECNGQCVGGGSKCVYIGCGDVGGVYDCEDCECSKNCKGYCGASCEDNGDCSPPTPTCDLNCNSCTCVPEFSTYLGIVALIGAIIIPTLIYRLKKKKT